MENKSRDSFVFYRSFKDAINELSDSDKLIIYDAIIDYGLNHEEPKLKGFPKAIFCLIKPQLDANFARWENGCKGKEFGKLGGNPRFAKGKPNPYYQGDNPKDNPKDNPTTTPNVNVNVTKKSKPKEILSFEERQENFKESLYRYTEQYGEDIITRFYKWWSEPQNIKGHIDGEPYPPKTKMKWEMEKTWSLGGRLSKWK